MKTGLDFHFICPISLPLSNLAPVTCLFFNFRDLVLIKPVNPAASVHNPGVGHFLPIISLPGYETDL